MASKLYYQKKIKDITRRNRRDHHPVQELGTPHLISDE